ncbi:hypothetical protein Cme02nite_72660 [Catellatospora methionotrophica]|uniref:Uncharacterized protein n=1 Tax=Catellatospora methionotrophica TaxID=121620 RepID=A0A8J3PJL5_9ACTN|nr:hypothetical protein [Catellatospora methionotrophica]GIG18934.1 hypothetical protein Cme02nite_72660 [Catellatospora methionotrophica]
MNDDLFQPTIGARPVLGTPPWRPSSIVYPAFFGGALAVTILGVLNARRLSLGRNQQLAVAAAGLAATAVRLAVTVYFGTGVGRPVGVILALAVWGLVTMTQKQAFRAYEYGDGEPASLLWPGLAAAIGCGLLENILIAVVVD